MLPKVIKADMAEMMESIKEYCRSCHGNMRVPLAYVIRKIATGQTNGDYPEYNCHNVTPIPKQEQIAQWAKSTVSQIIYSRVHGGQQKCLWHPGSDLQWHWFVSMTNSISPWGTVEGHFMHWLMVSQEFPGNPCSPPWYEKETWECCIFPHGKVYLRQWGIPWTYGLLHM